MRRAVASAKRRNTPPLGSSNWKGNNMTKQHFIALADEIRKIENPTARAAACLAVENVAEKFNPRFDWKKFRAACDC